MDNFPLCVRFFSVHLQNNFICHQNLHFWTIKDHYCPVIKLMFSTEKGKVYASQMKKESQTVSAQTWELSTVFAKKKRFIARCYLSLITCKTYFLIYTHSAPWIYESCRPNSRIQEGSLKTFSFRTAMLIRTQNYVWHCCQFWSFHPSTAEKKWLVFWEQAQSREKVTQQESDQFNFPWPQQDSLS